MWAPICALNLRKTPTICSKEFCQSKHSRSGSLPCVVSPVGGLIAPRGNPHIPPLSTFPMHRHKPLTSCRAWEARRDPLFPLCHLVGAALEAAGVSGHGVCLLLLWVDSWMQLHGASGGSCGCSTAGKCCLALSFLLLASVLVGSTINPPGLGTIYSRSNPPGAGSEFPWCCQ